MCICVYVRVCLKEGEQYMRYDTRAIIIREQATGMEKKRPNSYEIDLIYLPSPSLPAPSPSSHQDVIVVQFSVSQ